MKQIDSSLPVFKGNTHAHTTNSDGRVSPEECMRQYKEAGYDFLALTDHWAVGEETQYRGMLILPGIEYDFTYPTQVLHIVGLYPDAKLAAGMQRVVAEHDGFSVLSERRGHCRGVQYHVRRTLQRAARRCGSDP